MKKKRIVRWACILLVYLILLLLLVAAESGSPDSGITSLPKAVWYSLVTMTTVGYGDYYPVTLFGQFIGVLFLLCSAGALTALISLGVGWVTGSGLPKLKLKQLKGNEYYIFDRNDPASRLLAESILKEKPEAVCILSGETSDGLDIGSSQSGRAASLPLSLPEILGSLPKSGQPGENAAPTVFFTGVDAETRMAESGLTGSRNRLVCEVQGIPEELSDSLLYYDTMDLRANRYWQMYPLALRNQTVVLIGFGALGRLLLEHGLQGNILEPVRSISYHVFGDGSDFLRDHHQLGAFLSIGKESETSDSLHFHEDAWNSQGDLLMRADRIIFCDDCGEKNLKNYRKLRTYFPVSAVTHLYSSNASGESYPVFGSDQEIYTGDNLFRPTLEQAAKHMHDLYRNSADYPVPAWEELSSFLRRSNIASAEHVSEKMRFLLQEEDCTEFTKEDFERAYQIFCQLREETPDLCRQIEHNRWNRFHAMYNWSYSPVRDNARRQHPLLVEFDRLVEKDRCKDDYAWELLKEVK